MDDTTTGLQDGDAERTGDEAQAAASDETQGTGRSRNRSSSRASRASSSPPEPSPDAAPEPEPEPSPDPTPESSDDDRTLPAEDIISAARPLLGVSPHLARGVLTGQDRLTVQQARDQIAAVQDREVT